MIELLEIPYIFPYHQTRNDIDVLSRNLDLWPLIIRGHEPVVFAIAIGVLRVRTTEASQSASLSTEINRSHLISVSNILGLYES